MKPAPAIEFMPTSLLLSRVRHTEESVPWRIAFGIACLTFLPMMSTAHATSPQPPPDVADRYQIRHELIGYPPLPPARGPRRGDQDWLPTMRMVWVKHGVPLSA